MQGYTEDDTFDALRRIPVHELEKRLEDWRVTMIEDNVQREFHIHRLNQKELKRHRYLGWLTPNMGPILMDEKIFSTVPGSDPFFEGTGWTYDSYATHLRKFMLERAEHNELQDKKIMWSTIGCLAVWILVLFPIGLLLFTMKFWLFASALSWVISFLAYNHLTAKYQSRKKYGPVQRN